MYPKCCSKCLRIGTLLGIYRELVCFEISFPLIVGEYFCPSGYREHGYLSVCLLVKILLINQRVNLNSSVSLQAGTPLSKAMQQEGVWYRARCQESLSCPAHFPLAA